MDDEVVRQAVRDRAAARELAQRAQEVNASTMIGLACAVFLFVVSVVVGMSALEMCS